MIIQREQLQGIRDRGEKAQTPRHQNTNQNPGTYKEREAPNRDTQGIKESNNGRTKTITNPERDHHTKMADRNTTKI